MKQILVILSALVVGTATAQHEHSEADGMVIFEAEAFDEKTGGWKDVREDGRTVMRMSAPDGRRWEGRHMYMAYRVRFSKTGRYRLWGLMRSAGTKATDDVWVYWNRLPEGENREDFEMKVETTAYEWSSVIKDLPPPEPDSKRPKNRDYADHGFPVDEPGLYTLYISKGEEPFGPNHSAGLSSDFFAFDKFMLIHTDLTAW